MDGRIAKPQVSILIEPTFFPAHYIRPRMCGNRSKDFWEFTVTAIGVITLEKEI
ncbi:hypothetical protein [Fervidobacterium sp.]